MVVRAVAYLPRLEILDDIGKFIKLVVILLNSKTAKENSACKRAEQQISELFKDHKKKLDDSINKASEVKLVYTGQVIEKS